MKNILEEMLKEILEEKKVTEQTLEMKLSPDDFSMIQTCIEVSIGIAEKQGFDNEEEKEIYNDMKVTNNKLKDLLKNGKIELNRDEFICMKANVESIKDFYLDVAMKEDPVTIKTKRYYKDLNRIDSILTDMLIETL